MALNLPYVPASCLETLGVVQCRNFNFFGKWVWFFCCAVRLAAPEARASGAGASAGCGQVSCGLGLVSSALGGRPRSVSG